MDEPYFSMETLPSSGFRSKHLNRHELYIRWWIKEQFKKYIASLEFHDSNNEFVEPIIVSNGGVNGTT